MCPPAGYASPLLDRLDEARSVRHRLYRCATATRARATGIYPVAGAATAEVNVGNKLQEQQQCPSCTKHKYVYNN